MTRRPAALLVTLVVTAATLAAQTPAADRLNAQIDRIFAENAYAVPRFGPARWLPDGTGYTMVEKAAAPASGSEIVRYDAASGARSVLVPAARLVPEGREQGLEIDDYAWSADGRWLLVFTNTRKVWRDNTRGDYWVLDLHAEGGLRKLGGAGPEATLMFAKFSPDATRVAYVRHNDIYVERIDTGAITRLTADGSETTINGTSDWVYEEELGLRDAFRWSPDGASIAFWQFDSTGVGIFTLINDTDALYPTVTRIPYPKAGTTNSAVRIGVIAAAGGPVTWMQVPGDPREHYLARLSWSDARTVAMQQLNRLQNRLTVFLGDAATGDVRAIFVDESKAWVDVPDDAPWVDGGRAFLWPSDRDGWRHLYRVPRDGGAPRLVTTFEGDVLELAGVDEQGGWVYFVASPQNATQRYLFRSRLDGAGTPERVTPAAQPGSHAYVVAPTGTMAFHTYSQVDVPPTVDVVDLPAHRALRPLTDVTALKAAVAPLVQPPTEFLSVDVGEGVTLDGWLLRPTTFDAAKKYPVVVHVYGEPASQTVADRWGGTQHLFHRALAEAGYLVVSFDNRGTPAPKGERWRKVIYGEVGELAAREQAAAIKALAGTRPYVDLSRVGIWGASGGGSNTLGALFMQPDTFHVGVAVAPVPDKALYDTIYQERYMGTPQSNPDGYRRASSINFAEHLKGRLLLIHGSGDDNVHYQGTERLVNRLVELGKPFDLMVYPNRTHALAEGPGTRPHLYKRIARHFLEHLPAGPR